MDDDLADMIGRIDDLEATVDSLTNDLEGEVDFYWECLTCHRQREVHHAERIGVTYIACGQDGCTGGMQVYQSYRKYQRDQHRQWVRGQRGQQMREPIVKIFKDGNKNAGFAIATTARDAEEFLRESSIELAVVLAEQKGEEDFALNAMLPQICAVWAKLQGYKAEGVHERRVLIAGEPNPEAHMTWLNAPAKDETPAPA